MEEPTDSELVAAALQDSEAYGHVISRYRARLLRYIGHLGVRDRPLQEDILQEVLIKAYRNLNAYNQDFPFSSWIYRITHNETMTYFRKRRLQPLSLDAMADAEILIPIEHEDAAEAIDPQRVAAALGTLAQKYKEVLVLKYFEDKSYDEIADILQKPPGTVATLLSRAKKQLRELLEQASRPTSI